MPFLPERQERREVEEAFALGSPRAEWRRTEPSTQQILHMLVQVGPSMPGWQYPAGPMHTWQAPN
jgi:hypothetical protein